MNEPVLVLWKSEDAKDFFVLLVRNSHDTQLDNIARTVISNNCADIHIAIYFDSDNKENDKGIFYCGIPEKYGRLNL